MIIGIVGKPNVGKSTFFKALTLAEVAIAPYPFTTIEANQGIGFIKTDCIEKELKTKCRPKYGYCTGGKRFIPVKLVDVAGLVPGAHAGKGRGNQFLDDLREADVLIHVLDASGRTDAEGNPTQGYDLTFDVKFLQEEIELWMYGIIKKYWNAFSRRIQMEGKKLSQELATQLSGLKINEGMIKAAMKNLNLSEKPLEWSEQNLFEFVRELRRVSKPIIIAANKIDLPESAENIKKLKKTFPEEVVVSCSAESELALREAAKLELIEYTPDESTFEVKKELTEQQKKALSFVKEKILSVYGTTGVQKCINVAVFDFLRYNVIYPVENEHHYSDKKGNVLPDALLMPSGSTTLDLAFAIHTDIGKNFLSAIDVKSGKRLGKEHVLKNNDTIRILVR